MDGTTNVPTFPALAVPPLVAGEEGSVGVGDREAAAGAPAACCEAERRGRPPLVFGSLSNTPPPNTTSSTPKTAVTAGGEDWLEWFAYVHFPETFCALMERLESAKKTAQESGSPTFLTHFTSEGKRDLLIVFRNGYSVGGDAGVHFEYRISWHGVTVAIGRRQGLGEKRPNVHVQATGYDCLTRPAFEIWQDVQSLLSDLGGVIWAEHLSRVDMCCDLPGVDIDELNRAYRRKRICTTLRKGSLHDDGDKITGFSKGVAPLRVICYDKLEESMMKGDRLYIAALVKYRWSGQVPEVASRVEFQCRRDFLTEHGVDSPGDYFDKRAALIDHLTSEHFRITKRDATRLERCSSSDLWLKVRETFATWAGAKPAPLEPIDRAAVDVAMYARQAAGCLTTAAVQRGRRITSLSDLILFFGELARETIDQDKLLEDFERKRVLFRC